ncbi:MAG: outer membrane lipoprotein-sorting protein [Lentisphaeria bacterium]|nr:outer membrane lipoprotein-sorting protein [Lentisphaeria bacterium]
MNTKYTANQIALLTLALTTFGALLAPLATAQTPSVANIVAKANRTAYYQGKDGSAKVKMTITDARGQIRNREMTILRRDDVSPGAKGDEHCGDQAFYVYFHRPADVNKMVFMVWKHVDKDDDRWLYLPALDLVKRIAASDERTSFVGSDFLYEDVSGRGMEEDGHELLETTADTYLLKNTPKDPKLVEFSYYNVWIDRQTFMPVKAEYYDRNGKLYRRMEVLETKEIQGYPTVTKAKMSNLNTGGHTIAEYSRVKYDIGLPEKIFAERYLRRAPRKYLRSR